MRGVLLCLDKARGNVARSPEGVITNHVYPQHFLSCSEDEWGSHWYRNYPAQIREDQLKREARGSCCGSRCAHHRLSEASPKERCRALERLLWEGLQRGRCEKSLGVVSQDLAKCFGHVHVNQVITKAFRWGVLVEFLWLIRRSYDGHKRIFMSEDASAKNGCVGQMDFSRATLLAPFS